MKIRKAKKEDINQIADLFLDLHKFHSRLDKRYSMKRDAVCLKLIKRDLRKYFKKPKTRTILIYKENNKIIGFVDFWIEKKDYNIQDKGIWIYGIHVDKNYREQGIARELVKEVAKRAKRRGIKEIDTTYVLKNKESANFWKSLKVETLSVNAVINIKNIL